ncbi:4-sulfomuconolactone hydrolase [Arthroderma uncinatum]|uniref:4-sulfomuconolactone hydrolase n=1 Tax=Arthroderma uncinatum TaxID=74035 RepID=UPI00144AFA2C|nr:4-sulfomuconolactone hydrolase [Arthroderma uncinatum]KAF3481146.1 4-sulfomuconolactone hydrolase [Arthroderma uncinatum]
MSTPPKLPPSSWDSHMHIVNPEKYPLAPDAQYVPPVHTLADAMSFESSVGMRNIVLVQPSIYGFDNSCMLDGLKELGSSRGRAVVSLDPDNQPSEDTLKLWHQWGVRGVRLNLQSTGKELNAEELKTIMHKYADIIRPYGWVLQLYIALHHIPLLQAVVPSLGVKVCFDHFGSPKLPAPATSTSHTTKLDPYCLPGFKELIELLKNGHTYVKVSAAYRLTSNPEFDGLREMCMEFMRVAPDRVVFATDWPHTRFDSIDIVPFMKACVDWCHGDQAMVEKLFQRNAEELWDVKAVTES